MARRASASRGGRGQGQRPRHHRTLRPADHHRAAREHHEFRSLDAEIELQPILDDLLARPPLDLAYSVETEARFPEIAGGLSVALARSFKIIDPSAKNPQNEQWEPSFRIFDLLL